MSDKPTLLQYTGCFLPIYVMLLNIDCRGALHILAFFLQVVQTSLFIITLNNYRIVRLILLLFSPYTPGHRVELDRLLQEQIGG